jgi:hypothetical protein
MIPNIIVPVVMALFNFDKYLGIFRLLFYQLLPVVIAMLTLYFIWGIFKDMEGDTEDEEEKPEEPVAGYRY